MPATTRSLPSSIPPPRTLIYSTYIGGKNADFAVRMYVDGSGDVILGGSTNSPDFPTTPGAYKTYAEECELQVQSFHRQSAMLERVCAQAQSDWQRADFFDSVGRRASGLSSWRWRWICLPATSTWLARATNSVTFRSRFRHPRRSLPMVAIMEPAKMLEGTTVPCFDAFVAEFNPSGTQLMASTYLGGNDDDGSVCADHRQQPFRLRDRKHRLECVSHHAGAYQTTHSCGRSKGHLCHKAEFLALRPGVFHVYQGERRRPAQ